MMFIPKLFKIYGLLGLLSQQWLNIFIKHIIGQWPQSPVGINGVKAVAIINFQLLVDLRIVYPADIIPGKLTPVGYLFKIYEVELSRWT